VVNDVAAINIDVAVVNADAGGSDIVELGNGCVCCSNRDDLAETIALLSANNTYEHILVETSGVAEPRGIATLFTRKNLFGRSLGDFARLSALVSVVDAAFFLSEWRAQQERKPCDTAASGAARPVFELLVEQIECADVIVLNQCDRVDAAGLGEAEAIVRGLNERAELLRTEQGQIASELLLERVRFDAAATLGAARWIKILNTMPATGAGGLVVKSGVAASTSVTVPRHTDGFGIVSWVFQSRRPFLQAKFEALLAQRVPGLLRAKGFFWLAERPDEMGFVSVAGGVVRQDFPGYWWAALIENGKARREKLTEALEKLWAEPHGDRRQELVFIGIGLEVECLRGVLEECLEKT